MYCYKCGAQNDDNAFKCVQCGTIIQQMSPPVIPAKKTNPAIIVVIIAGAAFFLFFIIGILAAIAIPNFLRFQEKAREAEVRNEITIVCDAIYSFFEDYPDGEMTLDDIEERAGSLNANIELEVVDGGQETLVIQASHVKGNTIFVIDRDCNIEEVGSPMGS